MDGIDDTFQSIAGRAGGAISGEGHGLRRDGCTDTDAGVESGIGDPDGVGGGDGVEANLVALGGAVEGAFEEIDAKERCRVGRTGIMLEFLGRTDLDDLP